MRPTLQLIFDATLNVVGMSKVEYERVKKSHYEKPLMIRQIVSLLGQKYGYSLHKIGDFLDIAHCTVHHQREKAKGFYEYEKEYASMVDDVMLIVNNEMTKDAPREEKISGWIARDGYDDSLSFFTVKKPKRVEDMWLAEDYCYSLPKEAFPQITWESEPVECEMTLRLK